MHLRKIMATTVVNRPVLKNDPLAVVSTAPAPIIKKNFPLVANPLACPNLGSTQPRPITIKSLPTLPKPVLKHQVPPMVRPEPVRARFSGPEKAYLKATESLLYGDHFSELEIEPAIPQPFVVGTCFDSKGNYTAIGRLPKNGKFFGKEGNFHAHGTKPYSKNGKLILRQCRVELDVAELEQLDYSDPYQAIEEELMFDKISDLVESYKLVILSTRFDDLETATLAIVEILTDNQPSHVRHLLEVALELRPVFNGELRNFPTKLWDKMIYQLVTLAD
jgi:hypothetical protein